MYKHCDNCLNFDDDTHSCILENKVVYNRKTNEYLSKDCEDYESIDELINECSKKHFNEDNDVSNFFDDDEGSEPEVDFESIESEVESDMGVEPEDTEEFEEEVIPQRKPKFDIKRTEKKESDDEIDEAFWEAMEAPSSFMNMMKEFIKTNPDDLQQEKNDDVDAYISDDYSDEDEEETEVQTEKRNLSESIPEPSQMRYNQKTNDDIGEYSSVDDFVTTNEIIESYGNPMDIESVRSQSGIKNIKQSVSTKTVLENKQSKPTSRFAQEMNAWAEAVKSGKIDLDSAYGLGSSETETISDEEKQRQIDEVRARLGIK